ncbi:MAG: glycosyltransferase, partial [Flavobacteriaceae bacterium]
MRKKLIRITTVPYSLGGLLKGQLKFMSDYFEVVGISSYADGHLDKVAAKEGIRVIPVEMTRKITVFKDLAAVWKLFWIFRKEIPLIVHTHTTKAGPAGIFPAFLTGFPNSVTLIAG